MTVMVTPYVAQRQQLQHHMLHNDSDGDTTCCINSNSDTTYGAMMAMVTPHMAQRQRQQHHTWHNDSDANMICGATTVMLMPYAA
jgi:hypothetical protein